MLEFYNPNNAIALHQTGQLWSDTTMIELFFVIFVFLRFSQMNRNYKLPESDMEGEGLSDKSFSQQIGRIARLLYCQDVTEHFTTGRSCDKG
jgi:hypothetical protein